MKIQRLIIKNFRNLHACELIPGEGINILFGKNGQGKTNLLESIYLLSNLSPIRPTSMKNLIRFGSEHGRIHGEILCHGIQKEFSLSLGHRSKIVKVNGKGVSRGIDYFGEFAVILFSPESPLLIRGGPEYRRRFMDTAISRVDRRYLLDLKEYKKILEQRNRLLRFAREGRAPNASLDVWSEQMAFAGSRIIYSRYRYLADLAPACSEVFDSLSQKQEGFEILYRSSLFRKSGREGADMDLPLLVERFREALSLAEKQELRLGVSQLGPHLDDLSFVVGERRARSFASQGEARILSLSLVLGEAAIYRRKKGIFPVLLLDDVNSELDQSHQEVLSRYLAELGQVFLTTTENRIFNNTAPSPRLFHVQKGEIFLEKKGEKM